MQVILPDINVSYNRVLDKADFLSMPHEIFFDELYSKTNSAHVSFQEKEKEDEEAKEAALRAAYGPVPPGPKTRE